MVLANVFEVRVNIPHHPMDPLGLGSYRRLCGNALPRHSPWKSMVGRKKILLGWPISMDYLSFRECGFEYSALHRRIFWFRKKNRLQPAVQKCLAEFEPSTVRQATILSHCLFHDSFIWTSWTIDGYGRLFATVFPCPFRLCFRLNHLISFWAVISKFSQFQPQTHLSGKLNKKIDEKKNEALENGSQGDEVVAIFQLLDQFTWICFSCKWGYHIPTTWVK